MNTSRFEEHGDVEQICIVILELAQILLENGAETRRVFETTREVSRLFHVDEFNVLVTHRSVIVTVEVNQKTVTRNQRVGTLGVDLRKVSEISRLIIRSKDDAGFSPTKLKEKLEEINASPSPYPFYVIVLMVGLACGGFCRISGGDWIAFVSCSFAASVGFYIRHRFVKAYYEPMLCVLVGAFVSAILSSLIAGLWGSSTFANSVAASVLYLVPGIPMINAISDLLKGHILTGIARSMTVILTAVFVALGLIIAMNFTGLSYYK
jgi:uncharacterized membrane protein YjjP (DUF1212 family)